MESVKESLRNTIELLSEEEARQILEFARHLREWNHTSGTMKRLASHPAFKVPSDQLSPFPKVEPVQSKGIPASELLVRDRR